MSMPIFREIMKDLKFTSDRGDGIRTLDIFAVAEEYGRQVRDKTLEWAAENAETEIEMGNPYDSESWYDIVSKDSILKGKESKDLEI